MKRAVYLVLFHMFLLACRVAAQPCECKWPVDVIILQNQASRQGNPALQAESDSLKKQCRHLFIVAPEVSVSDTIPYTLLKAGKGNRIIVLGAVRLRKDGTPVEKKTKKTTFQEVDRLKKRHRILAAPRETTARDKRFDPMMPGFGFIIEKTFIRLDRGSIIFIKEL